MTAEAAPQISINDLQNVVKVIDAAAERGAFKGNELTAVGAVRDKVAAFLAAIPATEESAPEAEAPAAEAAPKPTRRKA
ncbi:hypothetical protein D3C87_755160 [compost metagenome]